ncbi:MAG: arsenosugar biosynthesis radical SAM protein ArsS [Deltaproteobacteria bacterium]|jgi:radical SAM/Cys-rich protein|nr:arsenosugar biosynthesis radical SAM protein ArsS [Deltaproteobacteria bacterium]MBW2500882.1 arsenosugar biosynthesis radical SAM protein ArsS [Deltaproteobacteria bacterium]
MKTAPELDRSRFDTHLATLGLPRVRRKRVTTLQVNIGLRCNLACHHCHVESGPKRSEALARPDIERILWLLERNPEVDTLDITGGAPELHEDFRDLVRGARGLGRRVIDRCNLTVFFEPGQQDTPTFLAEQGVDVVASLPCYGPENVERQRGRGVFDGSIRALQALNALGYGHGGSGPCLDLVYNPVGPSLPPAQAELEAEYRDALRQGFGIVFDRLLTITNMPIKRFAHELQREGHYAAYMGLLVNHFNPANLAGLMCRSLVSVAHDGLLYDCDFNQALELAPPSGPRSIHEIEDLGALEGALIATAAHCFGCTSGAGSSCGGALS